MLPLGALFAYATRQLGRVLSIAFAWATTTLFGRVPQRKQLVLSVMAIASLAWPVALAGVLVPSVATFLLAFVTIPSWLDVWVRPVMILLALALPAAVGVLSRYLHDEASGPLWRSVVQGYPTSVGLFVVIVWMLILAPVVKVQALLRRWSSAHVAIAVKPSGYDRVVRDVATALGRAGLLVHAREAGWAFELPGKLLAALGGPRVRRLVPTRLIKLVRSDLEIVIHPMDLSMRGAERTVARARAAITQELTFTEAYQTWTQEAQLLEDRLARAARGQEDLDDIGKAIAALSIDHEQWEVLYRLFLQVRLRTSPVESDALVPAASNALNAHSWTAIKARDLQQALMGLERSRAMATVEKSVIVDVPVRTAYDQWTQFEEFPRFMGGVESVKQLDDKRLHWRAEILGKKKEWDAEIVEQTPDRVISWKSTSGAPNNGSVTFMDQGGGKTKIDLRIDFTPEDPADKAGDLLGVLDRQVDGDLRRFKEFIEKRGAPTGAWRGEIHGGRVEEKEEEPSSR